MTPRAIRTAVAMLLQLGAAVLLALVALGRPWPADRGDALVFLLADRSASVATEQASKAVADVADQVTQAGRTVVRTIEFAGRPEAPGSADVQSTNIEAAIDLALNRRSTTSRAAIVVVSDGNATEGDTRRALQSAADAGVPLLWRTVEPGAQSPHIAGVLAAGDASPGQEIPISVQIFGKVTRPMLVELSSRDGRADPVAARIAPGTPGSVSLPVRAVSAGTLVLDATLRDESSSNIVDAWRDAVAIDVAAPAEILFVAAGPSVLARSLRDGGWTLDSVTPSGLDAKAGSLDRYAAVVLDDVPASAARPATWAALQSAVRDAGTGLLVLGGAQSFAAGSYGDSRLESLLPVLSRPSGLGDATALVFVVDKSGSMGATSAGVDRFRLAQRAVIETATMLTDRDSAALVAFDAEPRTLLPLQGAQAFREAVARPWPAQPKGGTRIAPALEAAVRAARIGSGAAAHHRARHRWLRGPAAGSGARGATDASAGRTDRTRRRARCRHGGARTARAAGARHDPACRGSGRVAGHDAPGTRESTGADRARSHRGPCKGAFAVPAFRQDGMADGGGLRCHDAGAASHRPPRIRTRRSVDRIRAGGARTGGGGHARARHVVAGLAAMAGLARACRWTGRMGFIGRFGVWPAGCSDRSPSDAACRCRRRQRRQVVECRLGTGTGPASVRAHHRHTAGDVRRGTLERRDRRTGGRSLHALGHCTGRGTTPRPPACAAAGVWRRAAESGYCGVGAGWARARVVTRGFPGNARWTAADPRGIPIAQ